MKQKRDSIFIDGNTDKGLRTPYRVKIYVDADNAMEIYEFLEKPENRSKFIDIKNVLFGGHLNHKLYGPEKVSKKAKHITAMKFSSSNGRIYCKEIKSSDGIKIIMMGILVAQKKNTELKHKEISAIERLSDYNYDI